MSVHTPTHTNTHTHKHHHTHTYPHTQSLPFLRDHFLTEVYAAPPPHPALDIVAAIQHTTTSATKTNTSASRGGYTHRLEYALHMPGGNHASLVFVLPVDGSRIVRWSFTDTPVYTVCHVCVCVMHGGVGFVGVCVCV